MLQQLRYLGEIMGRKTRLTPTAPFRSMAALYLLILFAQCIRAELACPVRLSNGNANQKDLGLTFMDTAKVPIRQLEFFCTPIGEHSAGRSVCHVETGIFYPGTPYPIRFSFSNKGARTILVSLKSVRLSEEYLWTSTHDEPCRSLRIYATIK